MTIPDRKIVLGLGNLLNKDEGLGVHALHALQKSLDSQAGLELLDGGVLGYNLLPLVEEASHLLILDAVDAGKQPGTLIELTKDQIPLYTGIKMSQHQITFQEVLGLALFRQKLPVHLHLLGIQPLDLSIGLELSEPVSGRMRELVARAREILFEWNLVPGG